jgi:hypothetical protein
MSFFPALEKKLDEIIVDSGPELPDNAKNALVKYLPWISLVLGLLISYNAYTIWHQAHVVDNFVNYTNSLSAAHGTPMVSSKHVAFIVWLNVVILIATAVLYILACPLTRYRKKSGWNLLFYALLLGVIYEVTDIWSGGDWATRILPFAGLYLLFQIKAAYRQGTPSLKSTRQVKK